MNELKKCMIKAIILLVTSIFIMVSFFPQFLMRISSPKLNQVDLIPEESYFPNYLKYEHKEKDLKWLPNDTFNASYYIHPQKRTTIIEPNVPQTMIIENDKGIANSTTKILIICHSAVENFMERTTIRETWGSAMDSLPIMLIFILGKTKNPLIQRKIHNEALLNNDLLQENFIDTYDNLSLKSVFMLKYLKFLNDSQIDIKFILKIDDDCYLNPNSLFKFSFIAEKHPFTIFGKSLGPNSPVHRLINSNETSDNKWTVPKYVYSNDFFPNAISGSGYFFDIEAGLCLYRRSLDTSLINLEDIYITGILRERCDINLINISRFHFMGKKICSIKRSDILIHHVKNPQKMYIIHELVNGITKCRKEP
uniref:Hexosyltransferase n=1 Tax=Lepeophtheirus salmonis TaxID=72036 RepID=A0A0K2TXX4_LEPSM